jgi:hypothetical protein
MIFIRLLPGHSYNIRREPPPTVSTKYPTHAYVVTVFPKLVWSEATSDSRLLLTRGFQFGFSGPIFTHLVPAPNRFNVHANARLQIPHPRSPHAAP